jgi:hypothetical protein
VDHDSCVVTVGEGDEAMSPYSMFKYSIRSEITRKYYERRLRRFLDFIRFEPEVNDIEKRCNDFGEYGKQNPNWALNHLIRVSSVSEEESGKRRDSRQHLAEFCEILKGIL